MKQVLKNSDALFENDVSFYAPLDATGKLDTTLFLFCPGNKIYKKLSKEFNESVGNGLYIFTQPE